MKKHLPFGREADYYCFTATIVCSIMEMCGTSAWEEARASHERAYCERRGEDFTRRTTKAVIFPSA